VTQWIRCSKRQPCPICQKPDGCSIAADASIVCCARVPSDTLKGAPFTGGWIHALTDKPKRIVIPKKERPKPSAEIRVLAIRYEENAQDVDWLANQLGVTRHSLERLQIGWSGEAFSFPMRNQYDFVTGITLRAKNGRKWSVAGSHAGLYWPNYIDIKSHEPLLMPEGPTDCAACLDLGFEAIGRFSNQACVDIIIGLLRQYKRRVVLIADNDEEKIRPDGSTWYPGMDGARRVARQIKSYTHWVKVVKPPKTKDVREWKSKGLTPRMLMEWIDTTDVE
jgi:hypothetical protein